MSKKILIIGAGEIGLSLGRILRAKNYSVTFWDKNPKVLESFGGEQKGLPEIVPEADMVFLCVPSWAAREALLFLSPYLDKKTVVVSLAKGIEATSLKTMDELLLAVLPKSQPCGLLSGMMIAEEIREGMFGGGVFASKSQKAYKEVQEVFAETNIYLEYSADLHGVALCGVLKNIYSLALGISFGLKLGEDARGYLMVLAIDEMKKIVSQLKGKQETILGVAGLGDLMATGYSEFSQNNAVGRKMAKGEVGDIKSEGLISLPSLIALLGVKHKKLPVLLALSEIAEGRVEAGKAFNNFKL